MGDDQMKGIEWPNGLGIVVVYYRMSARNKESFSSFVNHGAVKRLFDISKSKF